MQSRLVVSAATSIPAHNIFTFDDVIFSSMFDNGNLGRVEKINNNNSTQLEYKIWSASDNMGEVFQSKHTAWFHFVVSGLPQGTLLKIQIGNSSYKTGLYKHDMRPVYKSNTTNQKWVRLRTPLHPVKEPGNANPHLCFEHYVELSGDKLYFAFTYPYTYAMVQNDCLLFDNHVNIMDDKESLYCTRELLINTPDNLRVDLLTISSVDGASADHEDLLPDLFPDTNDITKRPYIFPDKEIVFVSARVHPGEVPAQHTLKGIINFLLDKNDLIAKELRKRYVFKIIPILNPDGVYRGHYRMDQFGQNLNRYYLEPELQKQPSIYAAKKLLHLYASKYQKLSFYLDLHAHASKRGCFIYGNVLDRIEAQVQNQLFCKLIALNSAHFDYNGCLFSKEHMSRIDPGDQAKGLTAEGCGRVSTYLDYGLVHSYTLECNYNQSKYGNEVPPCENDPNGQYTTPPSAYTTNPEPYTPSSWGGVGRACLVAILDVKSQNPCSRIPKSSYKSLDKMKLIVYDEVKMKKEFKLVNEKNKSFMMNKVKEELSEWQRTESRSGIIGGGSVVNYNSTDDSTIISKSEVSITSSVKVSSNIPSKKLIPVVPGKEKKAIKKDYKSNNGIRGKYIVSKFVLDPASVINNIEGGAMVKKKPMSIPTSVLQLDNNQSVGNIAKSTVDKNVDTVILFKQKQNHSNVTGSLPTLPKVNPATVSTDNNAAKVLNLFNHDNSQYLQRQQLLSQKVNERRQLEEYLFQSLNINPASDSIPKDINEAVHERISPRLSPRSSYFM